MLYNRIAVLRSERALSRQALAREVGVNPQTIGFLERGDYTPSLELAFKLAGSLGCQWRRCSHPTRFGL